MKKYISLFKIVALCIFTNRPRSFWWSIKNRKEQDKENYGDILTPYIINKVSGKKPILIIPKSLVGKIFSHSVMVGSIINNCSTKSLVWGSGIIKSNENINKATFLAVRGPYTAKRLVELGLSSTAVYGDPGLMLPLLYKPEVEKNSNYGLIAHYVDEKPLNEVVHKHPDVSLISLLTDEVEKTTNRILENKKIISTSLHGLIISHAYGIPALWWRYSDNLSGDDIKFKDYFESVGLDFPVRNSFQNLREAIDLGVFLLPDSNVIKNIQKNLLFTYPHPKLDTYA